MSVTLGLLVAAVCTVIAVGIIVARRVGEKNPQPARPGSPQVSPARLQAAAVIVEPRKRRLPGIAATDAYAVVPQHSPRDWILVPPKTMDFSDVD